MRKKDTSSTRGRIREMNKKDTLTFTLSSIAKCLSVRSTVWGIKREENRDFTTEINYENKTITITRTK